MALSVVTDENNKIFSQVTENTYSNDITNWHLGRLSSAKVTHNATISDVVTVGVFSDLTKNFIVTCGAYSNSTDITVVINIGLTGNNGDRTTEK
jgi:hypothetical protein